MSYRPPLLVLLILALAAAEPPPAVQAGLGVDGTVSLVRGGQELCTLAAHWADPRWRQARASWSGSATAGAVRSLHLACDRAAVDARIALAGQEGMAAGRWTFTARSEAAFGQLGVLVALPAGLAGGRWEVDGATGLFPEVSGAEFRLHRGPARRVAVSDRAGNRLELALAAEAVVQVQDDRRWQSGFSLRIGAQEGRLAAGESLELELRLSAPGGIAVVERAPTVIAAGAEWIPLAPAPAPSPEPGSALDLSQALPPAGRVAAPLIATPEGRFASADAPGERLRFYGVNLCGDAQFLPPEQVERLCDRFLRLGYNALRIHHWEATLGSGADGGWDPARLAQLDHLLEACGRRGIRVAIDLYCSRTPVAARLALPAGQEVDFQGYKVLVPVHEPAFADWAAHARRLLDHRNPRTGLRWAEDPTLSWVALINEGNPGNFWRRGRPRRRRGCGRGERAPARVLAGTVPAPGRRPGLRRRHPGGDAAAHDRPGARRARLPGADHQPQWLDQRSRRPAGARGAGLRRRPLLCRPSGVPRPRMAAAQPLRQRQPAARRRHRRGRQRAAAPARQAVHHQRVQLFRPGPLPRHGRDPHRGAGGGAGLGRGVALRLRACRGAP
ncbi:MAG: hypothetical protein L6R48_00550 [Planctomycetes bacterium]|nr:hypothetical protein [Planctomycetota bacterium]